MIVFLLLFFSRLCNRNNYSCCIIITIINNNYLLLAKFISVFILSSYLSKYTFTVNIVDNKMILHETGVLFFDPPGYSWSLGNSHHFCLFLATFQKNIFLRTLELIINKPLQQRNNLGINSLSSLLSFE